jgi:hypothetical protein
VVVVETDQVVLIRRRTKRLQGDGRAIVLYFGRAGPLVEGERRSEMDSYERKRRQNIGISEKEMPNQISRRGIGICISQRHFAVSRHIIMLYLRNF